MREVLRRIAPDDSEEADGLSRAAGASVFTRIRTLRASCPRVKISARGLRSGTPGMKAACASRSLRAFVQPEVVEALFAERRRVLLQAGVEFAISAPELIHEERVEDTRRFDEVWEAPCGRRRTAAVSYFGVTGASAPAILELGKVGHNGSGGHKRHKGLAEDIVPWPVRGNAPQKFGHLRLITKGVLSFSNIWRDATFIRV